MGTSVPVPPLEQELGPGRTRPPSSLLFSCTNFLTGPSTDRFPFRLILNYTAWSPLCLLRITSSPFCTRCRISRAHANITWLSYRDNEEANDDGGIFRLRFVRAGFGQCASISEPLTPQETKGHPLDRSVLIWVDNPSAVPRLLLPSTHRILRPYVLVHGT